MLLALACLLAQAGGIAGGGIVPVIEVADRQAEARQHGFQGWTEILRYLGIHHQQVVDIRRFAFAQIACGPVGTGTVAEQDDLFRLVLQGQVDAGLDAREHPLGMGLALLDRIDRCWRSSRAGLRRFSAAGFGGAFRGWSGTGGAFHFRPAGAVRGAGVAVGAGLVRRCDGQRHRRGALRVG
ncbi:hypothetical protein D9M70_530860 [compost metagenome]